MREIKFRAWDKEGKRMGSVSSLQFHRPWATKEPDGSWIDVAEPQASVLFGTTEFDFNADELIVMQFTSLKDKNGKEIYEGDIVRSSRFGCTVVIEWHTGIAAFIGNGGTMMFELGRDVGDEVIGNIYETPELLRGKK